MGPTDNIISKSIELHEIALVQPGYLSRSRVRPVDNGTHRLLQSRDISAGAGIRLDMSARFRPERTPQLYQVSRGDILVVARGRDHHAHLIVEDLANTLASSVFYIIRPNEDLVLPGYLAWWLNLPHVQAEINASSCGTSIEYISRLTMEHLAVTVPPLDVQRQIEKTIALWREHKSLQSRLNEKRQQLIQAICEQAIGLVKE